MAVITGRTGRTTTSASLRKQYDKQLAELADKVAAKPAWAAMYMGELETLRGRADALADIEKNFGEVEQWAVKETMTATEMLVLKFDVVAELLVDAGADLATVNNEYYKGRYQTVRDAWRHLRRDSYFPGNQ